MYNCVSAEEYIKSWADDRQMAKLQLSSSAEFITDKIDR